HHAFIYDNGNMTDLGTLAGGNSSMGVAINDAGEVAGHGTTLVNGQMVQHGFFYSQGRMVDIGTLAGEDASVRVSDINNLGQVLGFSDTGLAGDETDFFIYDHGVMSNLDDLVAGLGINDVSGAHLADNGYIAGWGRTASGSSIGFLLAPGTGDGEGGTLPEPTSLALVGLGLAGAIATRRKQSTVPIGN
ncbi:PEP-CTERM sorting domain-containing protein, partial [Nostoc sp. NIES-2111]